MSTKILEKIKKQYQLFDLDDSIILTELSSILNGAKAQNKTLIEREIIDLLMNRMYDYIIEQFKIEKKAIEYINKYIDKKFIPTKDSKQIVLNLNKLGQFIKKYHCTLNINIISCICDNPILESQLEQIFNALADIAGIDHIIRPIIEVFSLLMNDANVLDEISFKSDYEEQSSQEDPSGKYTDCFRQYLSEISHRLLTKEEEIELGYRILDHDQEAINELVEHNLLLVISIAKKYSHYGLPIEDLVNEGNIGLIKAATKFDITKGYRFNSYATWWIIEAIKVALNNNRMIRIPENAQEEISKIYKIAEKLTHKLMRKPNSEEISKESGIPITRVEELLKMSRSVFSIDKPIKDDSGTTYLELYSEAKGIDDEETSKLLLRHDVNNLIKKSHLIPREMEILTLVFGLNGCVPVSINEIAIKYSVRPQRIRQILARSLEKIRNSFAINDFIDYADNPNKAKEMIKEYILKQEKTSRYEY